MTYTKDELLSMDIDIEELDEEGELLIDTEYIEDELVEVWMMKEDDCYRLIYSWNYDEFESEDEIEEAIEERNEEWDAQRRYEYREWSMSR